MKTKYTKKEKLRIEYIQKRTEELEELIKEHEDIADGMRKEKNRLYSEALHILNPDPLGFPKEYLPYGWAK